MQLTPIAQAIILLTVPFGGGGDRNFKCLTDKEWNKFAEWLASNELNPSDLLKSDSKLLLENWNDKTVSLERIEYLVNRGTAYSLALEKWQRSGLWIITRSDPDYPKSLKKHIGKNCPPVIFGCGDKDILNSGGLAVVGSRDASEEDMTYSRILGEKFASENVTIVSGGARGIDQSAMFGALDSHGRALGILSDSLLRSAASRKYCKHILDGNLTLISAVNPESRFFTSNAMIRNKYIYCLSDTAVVVCSVPNKGGTWAGAVENLKSKWVPMWVKKSVSKSSGNPYLAEKGANWIPENLAEWNPLQDENSFKELATKKVESNPQLELNLQPTPSSSQKVAESIEVKDKKPVGAIEHKTESKELENNLSDKEIKTIGFYELFLEKIKDLTKESPLSKDELIAKLELKKTQLEDWLKKSIESGKVKKLNKPVRYEFDHSVE